MEQRDSSTLVLIVVGALLLVLGAAWLFLTSRSPSTPPATTVPPAITATPAGAPEPDERALQQDLEFGALAFNAGQLIRPEGGSALHFYLRARERAPDNDAVTRGLEQVAQQLTVRGRVQLTQQDFAALGPTLQAFEAIDAGDERLLSLRNDLGLLVDGKIAQIDGAIRTGQWDTAQALLDELAGLPSVDADLIAQRTATLEAARASGEAPAPSAAAPAQDTAAASAAPAVTPPVQTASPPPATVAAAPTPPPASRPAPPPADPTPEVTAVDALLASVRSALDDGRLTVPVNDSAAFYLREVQRVEPDHPRLASGMVELVRALCDRALASAQNADWNGADESLAQAESFAVAPDLVDGVRNQILAERIARESARVVSVSELQNVKVVQPRYPNRALRNNAEGWVVVNFTVLPDGTVSDVAAVETSERYGTQFGRAAETAVRKWEFVPRVFLGQTIPQRVEARLTFQIGD